MDTVRVQKIIDGKPKNAPFRMRKARAKALVAAHSSRGDRVQYKLLEHIEVPEIEVEAPKKKAVVDRSVTDLSALNVSQAIDHLREQTSFEYLAECLRQESSGKQRKTVIEFIKKALVQ